jgi:hypothetical protein
MFGTTRTLTRFVAGIAVVAALGALAVPAGLAGGFQTDTVNSARVAHVKLTYGAPVRFQTDNVNSARVANGTYDQGLDPAIAAAIKARQSAQGGAVGFQTDNVNSALVAGGSYTLDPAIATAMAAHEQQGTLPSYQLPGGFQTDTVNSARLAPVVERIPSGGFDWSSFGIGIGAGIGGLLLLAGLASRVRPLRRLANA